MRAIDDETNDWVSLWENEAREAAQVAKEAALAATATATSPPEHRGAQPAVPAPTPKGYGAAHRGANSRRWTDAEDKEWHGLWARGTFDDQPHVGQKLHRLIWTYKVKSDGTFKARLCLDGRQQDSSTYGDIRRAQPCDSRRFGVC